MSGIRILAFETLSNFQGSSLGTWVHVHTCIVIVYVFLFVAADVSLVLPQVPVMVQLIITVAADEDRSDSLVASGAGLLG